MIASVGVVRDSRVGCGWCYDGSRNVDVVFLVLAASTVSRVNVCHKTESRS